MKFTGHAARQRPLFVAVEDLHWIDEDGLDVLAALAQAALAHPVMLVFTARPESDPIDTAWRMRIAPTWRLHWRCSSVSSPPRGCLWGGWTGMRGWDRASRVARSPVATVAP